MTDQIEMSTSENSTENVFGPVTNFLNRQNSFRSGFSFNTSSIGRTPNSTWTPFNMTMAQINKRVSSFENKWPKQLTQRPNQMVASGFYYTGCGDTVTCFLCGITIRNWERTDDVDLEHKKHSPDCKFLLMCRQV